MPVEIETTPEQAAAAAKMLATMDHLSTVWRVTIQLHRNPNGWVESIRCPATGGIYTRGNPKGGPEAFADVVEEWAIAIQRVAHITREAIGP